MATIRTEPGLREWVAIFEIDRTGKNNGQGDKGSFTLTATDRDGAKGSKTYKLDPTDENLTLGANAVGLSGSTREDASLRVSFDETKDPDLAGADSPVLVLYTWARLAADADDSDAGTVFKVTTSSAAHKLTQDDVGSKIKVTVSYYELFNNAIVNPSSAAPVSIGYDVTDRVIANTPDKGKGVFTITAASDTLTAVASVTDEDSRHGRRQSRTRWLRARAMTRTT